MKKKLLSLLILVCIVLSAIPAFAMENEPGKFRGIPWGAKKPKETPLGGYEWALKKGESSGPLTKFYRSENVVFAGVTISEPIEYVFHSYYGFVVAAIQSKGRENFDLFAKECVRELGLPDVDTVSKDEESNCDVEMKFWVGKKVMISLMYYFDESQECVLGFIENRYLGNMSREQLQQD